jgi:hypothetical protein
MKFLESTPLDQRVRADLIAQFNRAGMFLDRRHRVGTYLRTWWPQIVIGIIIAGSVLAAATIGIIAEYGEDVHVSSEAPTIEHQMPTPAPSDIYDGD